MGYTHLFYAGFLVLLALIATAVVFLSIRSDKNSQKAWPKIEKIDPPPPDKPVYPAARIPAPTPAASPVLAPRPTPVMRPPVAALPRPVLRPRSATAPLRPQLPPPTPPVRTKKKHSIEVIERYDLRDSDNVNPLSN